VSFVHLTGRQKDNKSENSDGKYFSHCNIFELLHWSKSFLVRALSGHILPPDPIFSHSVSLNVIRHDWGGSGMSGAAFSSLVEVIGSRSAAGQVRPRSFSGLHRVRRLLMQR
jgi:hypothetical protein